MLDAPNHQQPKAIGAWLSMTKNNNSKQVALTLVILGTMLSGCTASVGESAITFGFDNTGALKEHNRKLEITRGLGTSAALAIGGTEVADKYSK